MMSEDQNLPLWVRDREEVITQADEVQWRYGERPDYSHTNKSLEKERKFNHAEKSLNCN